MCYMCVLIKDSFPTPKAFAQTTKELNISETHAEELLNYILDNLPETERPQYKSDVINEFYREFLRST